MTENYSAHSVRGVLEAAGETADARSATSQAADWLHDHLTAHGGTDDSASIKAAGAKVGYALDGQAWTTASGLWCLSHRVIEARKRSRTGLLTLAPIRRFSPRHLKRTRR